MKKIGLGFLFALFTIIFMACGGITTTLDLSTTDSTTSGVSTVAPITTIPTTEDFTTDSNFEGVLPNGLYEYYDMDIPIRSAFYDAKAEYALNNLVMGIPIYRDSLSVQYFSNRIDLPLDYYDENLNFNEFEANMLASDEGVTLLSGEAGKSDEYTFRAFTDTLDSDWNHLDSSNREALLARYNEAPYKWVITDGVKALISNYFVGDPVMSDLNPDLSFAFEAKVFDFTLKDNLKWQYNSFTDTSILPEGHENIDAEDFVYTYKYALRRNFRASAPLERYGILYADKYHDAIIQYEDSVGIQVVDNLTFRLTFTDYISLDLVKEMLTEVRLAPINSMLHEELGGLYADDIYSIAYSGNFYIDQAASKYVKLLPNPHNLNPNNNFTAIEFKTGYARETLVNDFNSGLFDMIDLDAYSLDENVGIDGEKLIPHNSFKSIAINGKLIAEDQGRFYNSYTKEFEPILSNPVFQKALYYAINREDITSNVVDYKLPLADYFDPDIDFFGDFHRPSSGYAPDLSLLYFNLALQTMSDIYHAGETITLSLGYYSDDLDLALYLENNLEARLNDRGLDIKVDIELVEMSEGYLGELYSYFPYLQNYYPNQPFINTAKADCDLYLTEIFMDDSYMFKTDIFNGQLSGLNNPEIEVTYSKFEYDEHGQVVGEDDFLELWSFNAIQELFRYEPAVITDGKAMEEVKVVLVEATPFSFTMSLPYYYSRVFENIEFAVYKLDYSLGTYEYVYNRQRLLTDEIIISDDQANLYYLNIWFELKYYPGITKEMEFMVLLPMLLDEIKVDGKTASITLNTDDRDRVFLTDSVKVYERNGSELVGSVEYLGDTVIITGLEEDKEYVVKFLTDDDYNSEAEEDFIFKARFLT